jgi:preprotein translocase subunit SecE
MAKSVTMEQGGGAKRDQNADKLATGGVRERGNQLGEFVQDVRSELRKVTTPTREQVQQQTVVVIIAVFAFAFYFWVVDNALRFSLDKLIYKLTHH